MSTVNIMAREVAAKIVFYGPGLSGKTTTLKKIYQSVRPAHRGEMMSLATEGDRTLFFDFLPIKVERVGDCAVRLALYTVPGQVFYNATRKLVLQGADGVVFVADSQPEAMDSNLESLKNLEENLFDQGIRLERFPLVFQWNKRDIAKALPVPELREALNARGAPDFETCATSGRGVLDALKTITRLVIKDLRAKRVVPSARPAAPQSRAPSAPEQSLGLEDQIHQHLNQSNVAPPESRRESPAPAPAHPRAGPSAPSPSPGAAAMPTPSSRPAPTATAGKVLLGPASALAPSELLDYARAADSAFASAESEACVRACQEAVRRGLAYAGEGSMGTQGYLLGVDGTDLLKLEGLGNKPLLRIDDAAFALYVTMQVFSRLAAAGLPPAE